VEKVDPALVYHKNGKPESVRYELVNAELLGGYQEQQREIAQLKSDVAALKAACGSSSQPASQPQGGSGPSPWYLLGAGAIVGGAALVARKRTS
jgi:hypothetical protein